MSSSSHAQYSSFALKPAESFDKSAKSCRVCGQMQERRAWKQTGLSWICLLCSHPYCEAHKGKEEGVCEINHTTYYQRHDYPNIYPSLQARERKLGKAKMDLKEDGATLENGTLEENEVS